MFVSVQADRQGYVGRECPKCERYFKVTPGTGLPVQTCICPYCGKKDGNDHFFTQDQIEYAHSLAIRKVEEELLRSFKSLEFDIKPPSGGFGIGASLKVTSTGGPHPIHYYTEKRLETEVLCDRCGLKYAIYGVFGYCPDCGSHNNLVILTANLELIEKMLVLSEEQTDSALRTKLVENALADCVSAFDGWGRATVLAFAAKAADAEKAKTVSFQNIGKAAEHVLKHFGLDLRADATASDFEHVSRLFQKRHLIAHKMGVIDEEYVRATGGFSASVGHKVHVDAAELREVFPLLLVLAAALLKHVEGMK